jgi:hypothetical protein
MATETLNDFFREKQSKSIAAGANTVDWGQRKRELVAHLEELYKTVEQYLAQSIREGSVSVSYSTKQITERMTQCPFPFPRSYSNTAGANSPRTPWAASLA